MDRYQTLIGLPAHSTTRLAFGVGEDDGLMGIITNIEKENGKLLIQFDDTYEVLAWKVEEVIDLCNNEHYTRVYT